MKRLLRNIALRAARLIGPMLFDRSYLSGRWFDDRLVGWRWVINAIWYQKILGFNRDLPVPAAPTFFLSRFDNLVLGKDNLNNFQSPGVYLQNFGAKIVLGDRCYIGPNVGIITANHDPSDPDLHIAGKDVVLGAGCWLGMNSVILPGVRLGPGTVVGAGSVVTKSFEAGHVVIAGNPARIVRQIV